MLPEEKAQVYVANILRTALKAVESGETLDCIADNTDRWATKVIFSTSAGHFTCYVPKE